MGHAPYHAIGGLLRWATTAGRWHELRGRTLAATGLDLTHASLDQFCDVVYASLVTGLTSDQRNQIDMDLGVATWQTPGDQTPTPRPATTEPGAPPWWGEGENADAFLLEQGVVLE